MEKSSEFRTDIFLKRKVNAEVMHRVWAVASSVLTVMPHSNVLLTLFALTGLNHKNSFKNLFIGMTMANFLAVVAAIIVCAIDVLGLRTFKSFAAFNYLKLIIKKTSDKE